MSQGAIDGSHAASTFVARHPPRELGWIVHFEFGSSGTGLPTAGGFCVEAHAMTSESDGLPLCDVQRAALALGARRQERRRALPFIFVADL